MENMQESASEKEGRKAQSVLSCKGVCKTYGLRQVLTDISVEMGEGDILGLLGPNGAGKTTLMKSVLGLVYPDKGKISLFGCDIASKREEALCKVGAIVEAPVFPAYLTGFENLKYFASLTGPVSKDKIMDTLDLVGLKEAAGKPVGAYSFGMKQRLGIAQALLPDSKFLILDEPTNGLDPHGIAGMRRLLKLLSDKLHVSIMVSSHLLHELEQVCNRIVIIHEGKKILDSTAADIEKNNQSLSIIVKKSQAPRLRSLTGFLSERPAPDDYEGDLSEMLFSIADEKIPDIAKRVVGEGIDIYGITHNRLDLESVFINMTSAGQRNDRIGSF